MIFSRLWAQLACYGDHILTLALGVHVRADGTDRMKSFTEEPGAATGGGPSHARSGRLFRKYATIFVAAVCLALVTNGAFDMWFSYQEQKALLVEIQRGQAESAASKISHFVEEIEAQMSWVTPLPWRNGASTPSACCAKYRP